MNTTKQKKKSKRKIEAEKLIEAFVKRHAKLGIDRRGAIIYLSNTAEGMKALQHSRGKERIARWLRERSMLDSYVDLLSFRLRYTDDKNPSNEETQTFGEVLYAIDHMEKPEVEPLL